MRSSLLRPLLRVVFGLALLVAVVWWLDPARVLGSLAEVRAPAVAAAVAIQIVAKFIWTFRWRQILRANGLVRGFWHLMALVFIGLFFNSFLPTGVGGDLVRGYYASRGRAEMLASYLAVLFERVLGMVTFAGLAALASLAALAGGGSPVPGRLLASVAGAGFLVVLAGAALFSGSRWLRTLERLPYLRHQAAELARALDLFRRPETPRTAILVSSLVLKLLAILFYALCARAVGIELPAVVFFLVVPASVVAAMLPVTLNGLGIREGVMAALLVAFGAPPAAAGAVAVLGLVIYLGFSLAGGLVYALYRRERAESDAR